MVNVSCIFREMPMKKSLSRIALALVCAGYSLTAAPPAAMAGNYVFQPAPDIALNRVYRLDKATGEVGACQYGLKEGTVGETLCYKAGDGAGPQPPGEYGLIASKHEKDGGVFRIDRRSGKMSVCFVLNDKVVCTPAG